VLFGQGAEYRLRPRLSLMYARTYRQPGQSTKCVPSFPGAVPDRPQHLTSWPLIAGDCGRQEGKKWPKGTNMSQDEKHHRNVGSAREPRKTRGSPLLGEWWKIVVLYHLVTRPCRRIPHKVTGERSWASPASCPAGSQPLGSPPNQEAGTIFPRSFMAMLNGCEIVNSGSGDHR